MQELSSIHAASPQHTQVTTLGSSANSALIANQTNNHDSLQQHQHIHDHPHMQALPAAYDPHSHKIFTLQGNQEESKE